MTISEQTMQHQGQRNMEKTERAARTVAALKAIYPDAVCSLTYTNPVQLLIAVRLSAQCTDARVNQVTPTLFQKYPTLDALCDATPEAIGEIIRSCGLFNTKARDIHEMALMLRDVYGGTVPDNMEALLKLPGVLSSATCPPTPGRPAKLLRCCGAVRILRS